MIIAVDGPSAAGKGTIARAVAKELGYHFLDTGSLYRMVGLSMLRNGKTASDTADAIRLATALDPSHYEDADLRTETVAAITSEIAQIPGVRAALLDFQRTFAKKPPGAVLDGRDIGTVICPDADIKLFVTASPEVRTRRRYEELRNRGEDVRLEHISAEVAARDARDAKRTLLAPDALVIDTSELTVEQGVATALVAVRGKV